MHEPLLPLSNLKKKNQNRTGYEITGFFYIMNMIKKMNAIEIVNYINSEVGMDIARMDDNFNIIIHADNDFLGNVIFFHDYLFCGDSIYSYINQHGVNDGVPEFATNSYSIENDLVLGFECFNIEGMHGHDCDFNYDTGVRKFNTDILKSSVEGLKKALKVADTSSKLIITNEVEFMDI